MEKNGDANILLNLIKASVGEFGQFQLTFWGQLLLGFLYSFGYFESKIAGFVLGFALPAIWIILTYRFVMYKSRQKVNIPFPSWMQRNPGNTLVIVVDILFLSLIWALILSGFYEATWLKVIFTMVFPIITLSMLRNLVIYPHQEDKDEEEGEEQ